MEKQLHRLVSLACFALLAFGCATPRTEPPATPHVAVEIDPERVGPEGEAHGFPALRNLGGETLASGEFLQWIDGDRLRFTIRYEFGAGRWVEESSVIQQVPALVQERWSWVEMLDGAVQRRFEVDFLSGSATAEKLEDHELHRWSKHVDVQPGKAFAGAGWALAIKSVRSRLIRGETIQFQTVGFTPKPKAATVEVSHVALEQLPMAGRRLSGNHFRIHPKIPWIVRAFVDVPDSQIWLANPPPAAFLRFEGPLAEPSDSLVRVDLLPGAPSEAASPANP